MATWGDFHRFIKENYRIQEDRGDLLVLVFELDRDRSQLVVLERQSFRASSGEWVLISSPIGKAADIDVALALSTANNHVVGGLTIDEDLLITRHAVPLANLDTNEIEEPLQVLCLMADQMEASLIGGDQF